MSIMSPSDNTQDGEQALPDSVDAALENLGNTDYLHGVLSLADPASRADQREPQQGRGRNRPRAVSSTSHTNLAYFDPRGVGALRHTLSRMSAAPSERTQIGGPEETLGTPGQRPATADVAGEAFDLEAVLRDILKRCNLQFCKLAFRTDSRFGSQAW